MSWSIEEHIGECRPFPAQVVVYRGETDECMAYVSGEVADRLKAENDKLHTQLADVTESMGRVEERCAKLRGLVKDMLRSMHGCTYHHSCGSCDFDECIYEERARELGNEGEE